MKEQENKKVVDETVETVEGEVIEEPKKEKENLFVKCKDMVVRNKKKILMGGLTIGAAVIGFALGSKTDSSDDDCTDWNEVSAPSIPETSEESETTEE